MCQTCSCGGSYEPTPREKLLIALVNPKYRERSKDYLLKTTGLEEKDLDKLINDCSFIEPVLPYCIAVTFAENGRNVVGESVNATDVEGVEVETPATPAEDASSETVVEPLTQYYCLTPYARAEMTLSGIIARIVSNDGSFYGINSDTLKIISAIVSTRQRSRYIHSRKLAQKTGLTQRAIIAACNNWLFVNTTRYGNSKPSFRLVKSRKTIVRAIIAASQVLNCDI